MPVGQFESFYPNVTPPEDSDQKTMAMSCEDLGLFKTRIVNLEDVGVSPENIGFANVTMQSENFICIRENKHSSKSTLRIIDLRNGTEISEKPMSADSAIMNPFKPHLALRAQNTIQVFNIDTKAKISSLQIGFEIIFWNWSNDNTILIVSESAVFLWNYEELNSIPVKWFDKGVALNDSQIINAETDKSKKWCFISGISLKNGKIVGTIQLYSEEKKVSQIIEGHAGHFITTKFKNIENSEFSLFAFVARTKVSDIKLHIIQIGNDESDSNFAKKIVDLSVLNVPENDFPIRIVFETSYSLVFVYTKFGFVYIIEPQSGICVLHEKISDSPLYLIAPTLNGKNHFVLSRNGEINNISINIEAFFSYCIENGVDLFKSVSILMENLPVEKQASLYRNQFDKMRNLGMFQDALLLVSKSDKKFLRTFEYLSSIKDFPNVNDTSALLEYFALVLENGKLNEVESLELVQLALNKKKLGIVQKWLQADQIFCTSQLGKVVLETDPELALQIFEKSDSKSMILFCLAILGRFDEFSTLLQTSNAVVDGESIISVLLKSKIEFLPGFLLIAAKAKSSIISANVIRHVFSADLGTFTAELNGILANNLELLSEIKSQEINTQLAIRLCGTNPELFPEFVMACEANNIELCKMEILPLLKQDSNLKHLAFSFECSLDECIKLSDYVLGKESRIKSLNLSKSDIKKFIIQMIQKDSDKYGNLCAKMGEFIDESDFDEVKELLESHVGEECTCDFLIFWSQNIKSNGNYFADDILKAAIKLGDESRLLGICQNIQFSNPRDVFKLISSFNYKSQALKVFASKYELHYEIISVFESEQDVDEAIKYFDLVDQDILWENLDSLMKNGISESFLQSLLQCPKNQKSIFKAAKELENSDNLLVISEFVMSEKMESGDDEIIILKLKILVDSDDDAFLSMIKDLKIMAEITRVIEYCEKKNTNLALKYYLSANNTVEIMRLSFELEQWECLSNYLIDLKSYNAWTAAFDHHNSSKLFSSVLKKAANFPDTESASCLLKVLAAKEDASLLLGLLSALLQNNDKLKSGRSLQTLYLINLIKFKPENVEESAIELDNYNIEEIVHAALIAKQLKICLAVLEKYEQWNYAFKIALYGLKDIAIARKFAQISGHPEAWHALAEFCLITGDSISASEFAIKSVNFRRQKELVIFLHLEEHYEVLLSYLISLKLSSNYEPIYERETFLCLMKMGKIDELQKFISSATPAFANELGRVLYREGSIELAASCFKQAGNFERTSTCFLKLGNVEDAAEFAMKTNKYELWLEIVKFSIRLNKFDVARKFGLKCSQQNDRIEELFSIYEECEAHDKLIEIIETVLESSAPPQQIMLQIGEIYCREFPQKLESFINKYYSSIQVSFIQILAKYRHWKEAFKFLLIRSNLDEALELVIKHPSIEFDHRKLTAVIGKIKNQNTLENLMYFYYECNPRMLLDLQEEFSERLDIGALIKFFKQNNILFIIDKTMRKYQTQNLGNVIVSTGLNEHLMQINDYYGLIDSIKKCPSIDAVSISDKLKSSDHRHFRVLAAKLMANSGEFVKALSILVEEDALIETLMILSQSNNVQYSEAVLARYARIRNAVMFLAVSYVLYDFIRPDVIFELSQRAEFRELSLPLFCQIMRHKLK